jgi:hypothetical protein
MMSGNVLLLSLYDFMKSTGTDFIYPCLLLDLYKRDLNLKITLKVNFISCTTCIE